MSAALTHPSGTTVAPVVGAAAIGTGGILLGFAGLQIALAAYLALNTVGNLTSSSGVERWAFGPATAIASALTAFVALRTRGGASA